MKLLLVLTIFFSATMVSAQKVKYRKSQTIDFDGVDVDGVSRSPDAAYLTQRKGIKFLPLYKVKKKFDDEIKKSVDYLR